MKKSKWGRIIALAVAVVLTVAMSVNVFAFTPPTHTVPATGDTLVVLAQYYDAGGQDVAFRAIANQWAGADQGPHPLRPDDSGNGIGPILNVDADGNIECIGWTVPGMWVNYTVNFPEDGTYAVTAMIAVPHEHTAGITIAGNTVERTMNTGDWGGFEEIDFGIFEVTAGAHVVRFDWLAEGSNFQSISIRLVGGSADAPAAAVPGVVNPPTGDFASNLWLIISGIGLVASLSAVGVVVYKKKK